MAELKACKHDYWWGDDGDTGGVYCELCEKFIPNKSIPHELNTLQSELDTLRSQKKALIDRGGEVVRLANEFITAIREGNNRRAMTRQFELGGELDVFDRLLKEME